MMIDHVTVCGSDLERMRQAFARFGFLTRYGGAHANGVTHMALTEFADGSYLELIAPVEGADPTNATGMMAGWMPLMMNDAGAGAWAIRVSGIHERTKELLARGIPVRGPERGGRKKPDGTRLEWETAILGPGTAGSLLPFMIEDVTERGLRVQTAGQPLGVRGIVAVVTAVRDMNVAVDLFRRAFEWSAPSMEEHPQWGTLVHFADRPIVLVQASNSNSWLAKRVEKFGECPVAFLLSAEPTPRATTERWFGRKVFWLPGAQIPARIGFLVQ